MKTRQPQETYSVPVLRGEILKMERERKDSVLFPSGVKSAFVIPAEQVTQLDNTLMEKIAEGQYIGYMLLGMVPDSISLNKIMICIMYV